MKFTCHFSVISKYWKSKVGWSEWTRKGQARVSPFTSDTRRHWAFQSCITKQFYRAKQSRSPRMSLWLCLHKILYWPYFRNPIHGTFWQFTLLLHPAFFRLVAYLCSWQISTFLFSAIIHNDIKSTRFFTYLRAYSTVQRPIIN